MTAVEPARHQPSSDASKIRPPGIRHGVVPRPRLAPVRVAAEQSRLVLLSAPAGYGKSTLVAEWTAIDPRVTAWVHLDDASNDPVVLLLNISAALERVGSSSGRLPVELSRQRPRLQQVALPLLVAEFDEATEFVLVLDDVHVLTAPKALEVLRFITQHVPAGSQLMMSTRGEPGIALGRLRASGELVEVRTQALALDADETRAVAASGGLKLTEESAEALRERTEGWAAAVVLATLFLRDRGDPSAGVAELVGSQHQIADYLLEEVLKGQPEPLAAFLLGTSVLRRMSAPLCEAVLGVDDAAESLEALARSNAFVVPLDDRREWYRYHHLFSDFLRGELRRRHPELLRTYLTRAADWCEAYGAADYSFAYAVESGHLAQAGRIALAQRDRFARAGRNETLRLWLERCTDDEIDSDPQLAIAAAWVFAYLGEAARAKRFLAAAARGNLDRPSADGATSVRASLANARSAIAPDGVTQMLRDATSVYTSEKPAGTEWFASACRGMGIAFVLLGRPEEAVPVLQEGLAQGILRSDLPHLRVTHLTYLSFAATDMGQPADAHRRAVEARSLLGEGHLEETIHGAMSYTASAVTQLQRGAHTTAERRIEDFRRVRSLLRGGPWLNADLSLRCGDVCLDLGDRAGAVELAQAAADALNGCPDGGVLPARLERLDTRIRRGEEYELTPAELRLLHFLPTHLSLQEIADRVHLSRATVKTHVASIYSKLGVPGRSEAVEMIDEFHLGSKPTTTPPSVEID